MFDVSVHDVPVSHSKTVCLHCMKPQLEFLFRGTPRARELDPAELREKLEPYTVWTRGADESLLADPCLRRAAESTGTSLLTVTLVIASVLLEPTVARDVCLHGVAVNGHLCTSLSYRPNAGDERVGLLPISSFRPEKEVTERERTRALLPVPRELLEAAPDEPTLSLKEMDELPNWSPRGHDDPRTKRPWKHLILVSHEWGDEKTPQTSWALVKKRVNDWVNKELAKDPSKRSPRVKAYTREDFGVWVDFMMVPNGHEAGEAHCEECETEKTNMIQRINALLSLATVIPMNDAARHRGWILQELTLDAHGETKYEHRDRVSLMARHVDFTTDNGVHSTDDGMLLRCNEFVRLSQTPRTWPTVNRALLERLQAAGHADEASDEAWAILTDYARRFDMPCHRLKRLMAELPQKLALARRTGHRGGFDTTLGSYDQPFDLGELSDAIEEQGLAMGELAAEIVEQDRPALKTAAHELVRAANALQRQLPGELATRLATPWADFSKALGALPDGATDPEWGLSAMAIDTRQRLTRQLQWQQFVGVAMGLRAEWLHGAGLAAWVRLSAITEALTATKFMARLKNGQVRFSSARSLTLEANTRPMREQVAWAKRIASEGVRLAEMAKLYDLGREAEKELASLKTKSRS